MRARLETFLGGIDRQKKQKRLTDQDGSSWNPEQPGAVGLHEVIEEIWPPMKLSDEKCCSWHDKGQENQGVKGGYYDAPFAHDALLSTKQYLSQKDGDAEKGV